MKTLGGLGWIRMKFRSLLIILLSVVPIKENIVDKLHYTVKPLITNTSEEFIKCRLDNFSMSFILYYVNFSICENKQIVMNTREKFWRVPYNHLIKKLYICNITLSESEEYDIWWILSMYSLLRVSIYKKKIATWTTLRNIRKWNLH